MKQQIQEITARIVERSREHRAAYLAQIERRRRQGPRRRALSCGNLAHVSAPCGDAEKQKLHGNTGVNIGIVTAYNDMLSAHQPYRDVPELLKQALAGHGATAQVAGGVPAMCDGITQGRGGMELSLFSREVIAMSTAVALSHDAFDGVMLLGICDKIVPGLMIGALRFGHLPAIFVPSGPMPSGLPNQEKARVRQAFAQGQVGREELLAAESASYHSPGTCTFYGTANSNQLLMELMGVHLPGASFVQPGTELREAFHLEAAATIARLSAESDGEHILANVINEKAVVNAMVGLLATGGSTNHMLHIPAMAAAAGIRVTWDDLSELSAAVPLLTRIYPNGNADINSFQQAGGMAYLIDQLLEGGLVHEDVMTVHGAGLDAYRQEPFVADNGVGYRTGPDRSGDNSVLRAVADPFAPEGGLVVLKGNIGTGVIKVSAVKPEHFVVEAPARVFTEQDEVKAAFEAGELERDVVVVLRFQGPKCNGMPELHKLTPVLGVLQDRGFKVALVTDGRMSGASGKVPAAIHLSPEAMDGGAIARIYDGDIVRLDARTGELTVKVTDADLAARADAVEPVRDADCGQELFGVFRQAVGAASAGASVFGFAE